MVYYNQLGNVKGEVFANISLFFGNSSNVHEQDRQYYSPINNVPELSFNIVDIKGFLQETDGVQIYSRNCLSF